jgi:2-hydroxymuconate-semialdehyde hydrolase
MACPRDAASHGSGPGVTAWSNWRTVIPQLEKNHRVIAPDMMGFG